MVFKEFDDVVLAGDFNKLSGLLNVDAIELANDAQIVKWYSEVATDVRDGSLARFLVDRRNGKVVYLS